MTLPTYYNQATDPNFRLLAGFTSPPRVGVVTSIEASGQVRVTLDDPDGGEALAWPLNGFTYAVDDIVFILFVADNPESAIVLGARSPLPTLDSDTLDEAYVKQDGTTPLTADWDVGEDRAIKSEKIVARDGEGISLQDDAGNVGVQVLDGGFVGIGHSNPAYPFHQQWAADLATGILARYRGHREANNLAVQYYHDGEVSAANKMSLALILNTSATDRTAANIAASFADTTDATRTSLVEFNTAANGSFGPAMTLLGNLLGLNQVTNPQGTLHGYDGTGAFMFVSKTGINGTAQTLIPAGSGDVVRALVGLHVTVAGTTPAAGLLGPIAPGGSVNVAIGGTTYTYAVSASGALTVQRTAGSAAGTCALLLLWI